VSDLGVQRRPSSSGRRHDRAMGRFALGFIVAIVVVLFVLYQCAQALF
jgi:hypothetical protein